ncbi:Fungal Zn(2)-Cys(6) binuclear cluster domain-containing protein [Penicillium ucsense]|uniref:Fungal Zn(2)-Cys(6) binuclear cluster domain-containing protein n=1 Tax=Penicillium ucsense TaxID=2839758 RepID=A0A8J8W7A2_9EURO|nr:Fungal Zn(2)-Cys(6) binuclear cluster domain-containing protein [Penicillium ucsense]KAF7734897.1 Fungal Zn(2)-Cys(6) binuclear cluster domain-containing protein [Penicillium ucsense]
MNDPQTQMMVPGSAKPAGPSLLACLLCRHKHLKCDGKTPVCGRCQLTGSECQYTKSRRGYKGPSKKRRAEPHTPDQLFTDPVPGVVDLPVDWSGYGSHSYAPVAVPQSSSNSSSSSPNGMPLFGAMNSPISTTASARPVTGPMTPESSSSFCGDGYLLDIYYTYFHSAHPILPPLRFLSRAAPCPTYLEQVMKFIAAHFTPAASPDTYRSTVVTHVRKQLPSVEKVQSMLLLAIVLHSRNERDEARDCLNTAIDTSLELGLNQASFAETASHGDPIRAESLRRTWWELFVIEGLLTALGLQQVYRTNLVPPEVPLPCEERIYQDGLAPPTPVTITQFDARVFADDERDFSSYAYRIEAVRILARVVATQEMVEGQQDQVEAIDARIASWFHHLPESKSELMRPDGSVDEIMFQATMIVNGASIYLNFPRSDLLSSPAVASQVICGHHGPISVPAFSHQAHAMKAVKAASGLSTLAALRLPVERHTPFFICALTLSSIVQLAACSVKAGQMPDPSRDRIGLTIGVFKSLARTWAISQSIMRQIKAVSRDVMEVGVRPSMDTIDFTSILDVNDRFWVQDGPS